MRAPARSAGACIHCTLGMLILSVFLPAAAPATTIIGEVVLVEPVTLWWKDDEDLRMPLQKGPIDSGSTVETKRNGGAVIFIDPKRAGGEIRKVEMALYIGPGSQAQLSWNEIEGEECVVAELLDTVNEGGSLRALIQDKSACPTKLLTKNVVILVQRTDVRVAVENDTTRVAVVEGEVQVFQRDPEGDPVGQPVTVSAGRVTLAESGRAPSPPRPFEAESITPPSTAETPSVDPPLLTPDGGVDVPMPEPPLPEPPR